MTDRHPSGVHDFSEEIKRGPIPEQDRLFAYFIRIILGILTVYGIGMILVILFGPPDIAGKMVTGFGVMFTGVLGIGSGYLLGRNNNGKR